MTLNRSSRRQLMQVGLYGTAGLAGATLLAQAQPLVAATADVAILNTALYYEHQAIWAYGAAAGKLTSNQVGQAVLKIAQANLADHRVHRDTLIKVINSLGGTPVRAENEYAATLTPYFERKEGGLDADVNIAKLALALEVDAAIAYGLEAAKLKTPALVTAGASIGATEASHATLIRAAFKSLGVDIPVIPAAFVSQDTRSQWVLKV
ncbi:hypothetical protein GlitD10_1006 [Gloeomargarita lithophora Alchichica-D10]|uniref:DUF4439 domain-containing protein n=1 Tax=Gloeomargarita lithophora Alchichica-D10 TaxID=1188229 RepID=A0A1J0ABL8_9CYAN|nr:DUF4439 domain-containing protein [Gloeomargarita lithophora]APB33324.1 hypothetical protein GlitD10_1006 [Gloeomargarita lithophora Alchichica-D10]